ncbi:hypothetical protein H105_02589 [Trichophyton soudanense CBS 452.61]|uniref:Alpha-1,3-mannosyltransferase n=1 Tax=Trichophyton soudanense CBS 452.61 TaxID=1215331 RepID=A0A022XZW1_TRISD|nr:hypothetical protein H105_02589 [Trichophyton soudanense CBS 452.61]EZF75858.1 hypothetical protein H105_02589 [Trichophyton soudanense CBS 452.61]
MPSHFHPRSRSTMSLFTATLLASLLIVGVPHVFPCPAPRRALADSEIIVTADGQQIRRKRRRKEPVPAADETVLSSSDQLAGHSVLGSAATDILSQTPTVGRELREQAVEFRHMEAEAKELGKTARECPVPKPKRILGQLFGFGADKSDQLKADASHTDIQWKRNTE